MKILNYGEREALKQSDDESATLARYHRFIGDLVGASGVEIDDADIPISYEDYKQLMNDYPGWSYGRIYPRSTRWKREYWDNPPKMNTLYDEAEKKRKFYWKKYPLVKEQKDNIVI